MKKNIMPHWIKERTSKEDRSFKYRFLRSMGTNPRQACRMRDWTCNHIILFLINNSCKAKSIFFKKKDDWTTEELKIISNSHNL